VRPLSAVKPLLYFCDLPILHGVEVSCPKTINIKQYLNTNNFAVKTDILASNLHRQHEFILQNYFYKQFSWHHHIEKHFL
jgi:hypothetical protein